MPLGVIFLLRDQQLRRTHTGGALEQGKSLVDIIHSRRNLLEIFIQFRGVFGLKHLKLALWIIQLELTVRRRLPTFEANWLF